jgi:hypothetical protein
VAPAQPGPVLLVDFGNTLASETFMRRDSALFPTWTAEYLAVVEPLRRDWDTGKLSWRDLGSMVAERLGAGPAAVHGYMAKLCRSIEFYPGIGAVLSAHRRRGGVQALVTVNPDIFSEVCDYYQLGVRFDAVVTSWEQGSDDKVDLCWRALELLQVDGPGGSVLIDNLASNVDGWSAAGGRGYVFSDDQAFVDDVAAGLVPGLQPSDVGHEGSVGRAVAGRGVPRGG